MAEPPPDPAAVRRFLRGDLPAADWEAVARAVEQTPAATLAGLDAGDTLLAALRHCPVLPDAPATAALMGRLVLAESAATAEFWPSAPDLAFLFPPTARGEIGRLGPYRVLRVLGAGGMGVVFEAEDAQLGRRVALKAVRPDRLAGDTARRRFLNEARAAAAVESDYVVPVHQVGEADGVPFLAMSLLRGRGLDDRLAGGVTLPVSDVFRIGRQAALGLAAAHARGLVHRDVKPGNLFLEDHDDGFRVKVLDFGLARAAVAGDPLTRDGAVVGTPAFMAPEQARGGPVDARTDLFALGIVLYRAAVGALPFRGSDACSQLLAVTADAPEHPHRRNPELPPKLADLILRLLEKAPARRPPSARAVADELAAIEHETAVAPVKAPPRRRAWLAAALAGLAAAVLAQVVVLIRDKDGKETKLAVAPGSTVSIDADGRATVTLPVKLPPVGDARTAAEAIRGFTELTLSLGDKEVVVRRNDPLPAEPFRLRRVTVRDDAGPGPVRALIDAVAALPDLDALQDPYARLTFTPADLDRLAGSPCAAGLKYLHAPTLELTAPVSDRLQRFPKLTALGGRASEMDDARLKHLAAALPGLWHLSLTDFDPVGRTTPAGLAALGTTRIGELSFHRPRLTVEQCRAIAGLGLSHLGFFDAGFDDARLAALSGTRAVTLTVNGKAVTATAVRAFAAAHPRCNIGWDGGSVERSLSMDTPDEPFAVLRDGHRRSAHKSLAAAVAAARSGEVVEVVGEGPHAVGNLPPVEGRDVTLRAFAGTRPRIVQPAGYDPNKPWLAVTDGHLRMDGLAWSGAGRVWFSAAHGECEVRRCRLLMRDGETGIEATGPRLTVTDSVLMAGTRHSFITLGGSDRTTAEVSGCVLLSGVGNGLMELIPNGQSVHLAGNTVVGPAGSAVLIARPAAAGQPAATVTADRNLFLVETALVWPDPANPGGPKTVQWRGTGNVYPANDFIGHAHFGEKRVYFGWAGWRKHWGDAETGGRAEPVPVRSFFAPVRDDFADTKLDRSPAVLRELRKRFPDVGADPEKLFGPPP